MKRSLFRLAVLSLAAFMLLMPVDSIGQDEICEPAGIDCTSSWCRDWWLIPWLPFQGYVREFCCTWDGTNLRCRWRRGEPFCCDDWIFDEEEEVETE